MPYTTTKQKKPKLELLAMRPITLMKPNIYATVNP